MALTMTCRTCGAAFTPTAADIVAGPDTFWYCLPCRREQSGGYVEGDQGAEVAAEVRDVGDLLDPDDPGTAV